MGTTFVTLSRDTSEPAVGFWMTDAMLELWLRLLALHLPEPEDDGKQQAAVAIRNQWLLASRGYFAGCVPHGMEDACATPEGREIVRLAIDSLLAALRRAPVTLDATTLNLLGMEGEWTAPVARARLQDVGRAFLDLLDGRITRTTLSADVIAGSKS
jgi:hypothetical protein